MRTKSVLWTLIAVVLICFSFPPSIALAEKINLSLSPEPGKSYQAEFDLKTKMTVRLDGKNKEVNQNTYNLFDMDIVSQDDKGNTTIKFTLKKIKIYEKSSASERRYDSENPGKSNHPIAKYFSAFIGQGFSVIFTPQGQVKKILDMDDFFDRALDKYNYDDPVLKSEIRKFLKETLGDQIFKEQITTVFDFFPDKLVEVGDSWVNTTVVPKIMPRTQKNKYTYKKMEKGIVYLEKETEIEPLEDAEPLIINDKKYYYRIRGSQEGEVQLDEKTGMAKSIKYKQNLSGTLTTEDFLSKESRQFTSNAEISYKITEKR